MKVYKCSAPEAGIGRASCREEFRTASVKSMHAKQLLAAQWCIALRPAKSHPVSQLVETLDSKRDIILLCPLCRATQGALSAARMPDKANTL